MPIETPVNGIWDLDPTNPTAGDPRSEGDDHMRLIKNSLLLTFPNVNAIVNATDADLNILAGVILAGLTQTELMYLDGVTSPIQGQIDDPLIARTNIANVFTSIQKILGTGTTLLLDTGGPTNDNAFQMMLDGGTNGSFLVQNVNSTATGYSIIERIDQIGALASYLQILENGHVVLANNLVGSTIFIDPTGDVVLAPIGTQAARYKGQEIATAADLAALPVTASVMGTITAGGTITPPAGYTAAQTDFMVSMSNTSSSGSGTPIDSFACSVTTLGVTSATVTFASAGIPNNPAILNYIAVGNK